MISQKLSEYQTGYRAWSRAVLEKLPLQNNSEDFVFDNQMLAQCAYFGFRIGEISCPTKYFTEASSINFERSVVYGFGALKTSIRYGLQRMGLITSPLFVDTVDTPPTHSHRRGCRAVARQQHALGMISTMRSGWRSSGRGFLAIGLVGLAGLGIAAWISPAGLIAATDASLRFLRSLGFGGAVVFGILQVLVAVSGILPASLLAIVTGGRYGPVPGLLLAAVSTLAGAVVAFFLSRSLFRPTVERLIATRSRLRNVDALIAQDGLRLVCLLRISPVPFSVISYTLGLSSIDLRSYTIGTLASLPALCGYVFIGTLADASLSAGMTDADPLRRILLGIGGAATLVLTVRFGHIVRRLGFTSQTVTTVDDQAPER